MCGVGVPPDPTVEGSLWAFYGSFYGGARDIESKFLFPLQPDETFPPEIPMLCVSLRLENWEGRRLR